MEHAEVRERLEAAVLAPSKLQSLDADATADGDELRRHLASCAACSRELVALRETAALLAAAAPDDLHAPPEAKEAVVRAIRETGVTRPREPLTTVAPWAGVGPRLRALPSVRSARATRVAWLGLAAAAVVLVIGAVAAVDLAAQRDSNAQQARELARVTAVSDRLLRSPHSQTIVLRDRVGTPAGTVVYSTATRELVVLSDALAEPRPGDRYDCYVERDGQRTQIGYMHYSNGVSYWAGEVEGFAPGMSAGRFVVALSRDSEPVLEGEL